MWEEPTVNLGSDHRQDAESDHASSDEELCVGFVNGDHNQTADD